METRCSQDLKNHPLRGGLLPTERLAPALITPKAPGTWEHLSLLGHHGETFSSQAVAELVPDPGGLLSWVLCDFGRTSLLF